MVNTTPGSTLNTTAINSALSSAAWTTAVRCGVVRVVGADRLDFLHRLTTNDLLSLTAGTGIQTVLQTEKARIIDVLTMLHDSEQTLLLTSADTAPQVVSWLRKYIIMEDVKVTDVTSQWTRTDILGHHSAHAVQELINVDVSKLALCSWSITQFEQPLLVVRVPSVADLGFALIGHHDAIASVNVCLEQNKDILPQLDYRELEYLRICAGMGAHNKEFTSDYNPLEAGLLHLTSFTKGCYIGQEVIARLDSYNKVKQRVMGISAEHLEEGWKLVDGGEIIGVVTSTTPSCDGTQTLALAYIRQTYATHGAPVTVASNQGQFVTATIHMLPMEHTCQ